MRDEQLDSRGLMPVLAYVVPEEASFLLINKLFRTFQRFEYAMESGSSYTRLKIKSTNYVNN